MTRGNNKTVRYVLTNEDYLTLARAIEFEGQPRLGVAWTLVQRFAYVYPSFSSLHSLIEAYAQPINPLWFTDGELHLFEVQRLRKLGKDSEASDEIMRAKRRRAKANMPLMAISTETLGAIDRLFDGSPSPVPGSVHYRAPTLVTSDRAAAEQARADFAKARQLLDVVKVGDPTIHNWFFAVTGSQTFRLKLTLEAFAGVGLTFLSLAYFAALSNLIRCIT